MKEDAAAQLLADEAAAEAAEAAGPVAAAEEEDAGSGLHLMTGKERKKHVKKMQKQRARDGLEPLAENEIEALFAPPAATEVAAPEEEEAEQDDGTSALASFVASAASAAAPPTPPAAAPVVAAAPTPVAAAAAPLALDSLTVTEVGEWLAGLRLSVFVEKITEEEYDGETLADDEFGMDDIDELEAGKKPHRKKLLKAIVAARADGVDAALVPSRT